MPSTEPIRLFQAVHAHLDDIEANQSVGDSPTILCEVVVGISETVDQLLLTSAGHPHAAGSQSDGQVADLLERLGQRCDQLERVLAELAPDEPLAKPVLATLGACSDLALAVMEEPLRRPEVNVA